MNPTEIRIALATFEGWNTYQCGDGSATPGKWRLTSPRPREIVCERFETKEQAYLAYVHDYPNDLNAVHELEKKLKLDGNEECEWAQYEETLWYVVNPSLPFDQSTLHDVAFLKNMISATASQRCEALLRTLNLWKD